MKHAMEYMKEIESLALHMDRKARAAGSKAAQGLVPDEELSELSRLSGELARSRDELSAVLAERLGGGRDYAAMPLDELRTFADKCEADMQMCAELCGRITGAADLLTRLNMPGRHGQTTGELAKDARTALTAGDLDSLRTLMRRAQPYADLCALLRDDAGAMRRDAGLAGRVEQIYPQIAWFVRARAQLERSTSDFEELSDEAVNGLRCARTEESNIPAQCGCEDRPMSARARGRVLARAGRRAYAATAQTIPSDAESGAARSDPAVQDLSRRLNARLQHMAEGSEAEWQMLADEYPELGELRALASEAVGLTHPELQTRIQSAVRQARELESVIQSARGCLSDITKLPTDKTGTKRAVWNRMLSPDAGIISAALQTVCERRVSAYPDVHRLCARLLIPGQARGVRLARLEDMLRGIWEDEARRMPGGAGMPGAEWVLDWLNMLRPALITLGRWVSLSGADGVGLSGES